MLDTFSGYALRRVRLINFHNFVDETIAVHGSLFLIGNNGTGKTTIIDGVQLALTGGQQLTYNAATLLGGPRSDSGRTLAGTILQHDFESGRVGRQNGAIGYAAVELHNARTNATATIGVGAFAQSLDQRPELWGFIVDEPLANVPLTVRASGAEGGAPRHRPIDRKELIDLVGRPHVYDIGRYRTQIANRFFGGRENFERVADLLKASKAYKELVVKARDFEGLFAYLLPAPDHQVFQDIEATLQSLDKIEVDLKALRQEKDLLDEAMTALKRIAGAREAIERLRFIQARAACEYVDNEATQLQRAVQRNEQTIADARARLEQVVPQLDRSRTLLAELRVGEPARLIEEQERLEQERRRAHEELEARKAEVSAAATKQKMLKADFKRADEEWNEALRDQLHTLDRFALPTLPAQISLAASMEALTALREAYGKVRPDAPCDTQQLRALQNAFVKELDLLIQAVRDAQQPLTIEKKQLAAERAQIDSQTIGAGKAVALLPSVPGYAQLAAELDSKNIEWSPLYRLVDFASGATPAFMDAVEAFLGEEFLSTVFVSPEDFEKVKGIALSRYPGVPVADTARLAGEKPRKTAASSIIAHFETSGNALVRRFLEANLASVSSADLAKDAGEGEWFSLDGVVYAGRAYRRLVQPARGLLGSVRRQRAIEAQQAERQRILAGMDAKLEDLDKNIAWLGEIDDGLRDARTAVEERVSPWQLAHRLQQLKTAQQQEQETSERLAVLKKQMARAEKTVEQLDAQISAIAGDERKQTTGDIEKQMATLKQQVANLERERERYQEIVARHSERLEIARQQAADLDARRAQLASDLATQRDRLRQFVPADQRENIDRYVDEVHGGRTLKSPQIIEALREQDRIINREIGSLVGLENESHKGRGGLLHHDLLWTKYAFVYNEGTNELIDQNGERVSTLYDRLLSEV
ncbi:hypothetical protein GX586_11130, partial [bacterium]|nr:hypothetical protein [bacterium]